MWYFDYKAFPKWVLFADIACWGSLVCLSAHYFTCGG